MQATSKTAEELSAVQGKLKLFSYLRQLVRWYTAVISFNHINNLNVMSIRIAIYNRGIERQLHLSRKLTSVWRNTYQNLLTDVAASFWMCPSSFLQQLDPLPLDTPPLFTRAHTCARDSFWSPVNTRRPRRTPPCWRASQWPGTCWGCGYLSEPWPPGRPQSRLCTTSEKTRTSGSSLPCSWLEQHGTIIYRLINLK